MAGYDYALKLDDDTFIVDKIDYDLFRFVRDNGYKFAPFATQDSGHPRARQTQIGLRELAKEYIAENKIQPKSTALDDQGNWTSKAPRDPTIWDLNIFRSDRWENWWRTIDASGGIYAYRWGDLEIHSLYVQMYYPDSAWHGFDYYKKGIVVHGGHGVVHLDAQGRHRGKRTLARRIWNRLRRSVGLESIDA